MLFKTFMILTIVVFGGDSVAEEKSSPGFGLMFELMGKVYQHEREIEQLKHTLLTCGIEAETCDKTPEKYDPVEVSEPGAIQAQDRSDSCQDAYRKMKQPKSGEYTIYQDGKEVEVYCDFHTGFGYTYVSKTSLTNLSHLDKLYTDKSHVMIRHIRSDGQQKEVRVEQLSEYKDRYSLGFLLNSHDGYNWMHNLPMGAPYIYLGFLPKSMAASKTTQGYRVDGKNQRFRNCDSNPNSYIAFFANPRGLQPNGYYKRCCKNSFMTKWIDLARTLPDAKKMPSDFYYFFEMHMGGCGGYIVSNSISGVEGAAVGFRFDIAQ